MDFLELLETDVALNIFMLLDDPIDLVRASVVSQFWRNFVIENALVKHLCLRIFPQLSNNSHVIESNFGEGNKMKILERDHNVYASLLEARSRSKVSPRNCIAYGLTPSSTADDYPEDPFNTLIYNREDSYWLSTGQIDPNAPVALTYKLKADISIVTQIPIQPYQGHPICSIKSVRIGHLKSPSLQFDKTVDHNLAWTYTSPAVPMKMDHGFQRFKLSEPLLCIGGFLLIELLGRHESDINGLFYMRINCMRVLGLPLEPAFGIKFLQPSGKLLLMYHPQFLNSTFEYSYDDDDDDGYSYTSRLNLATVLQNALANRRRCCPTTSLEGPAKQL